MAVSVTVAGHEMIGDVPGVGLRRETLRVEDVLTARAVCSFGLINPPHVPSVEEIVEVTIDDVLVFGGIVTRVDAEDWGDRETMVYQVTCADWLEVADGVLINDISPAGTLKDVLEWMLTRLSSYGFTLDPAQADGPTFPAQAYPFQTYTTALNNLTAAAGGWTWKISPAQVLGAYPWGAIPGAWELEPDDLMAATMERDRAGSASVLWVRFGGGEGSPTSLTWTTPGNGTRTYDPPYTSIKVGPNVVTVDGIPLPVFPAPGTGWVWDYAASELLQDPTDPVLDATHTLTMTFEVAWPSYAVASVPAAYERAVIVDAPNVTDPDVAQTIATAELERRSTFPLLFRVTTRRPGLMAGQATLITLPQYGIYLLPILLTSVRLVHAGTAAEGTDPWWRFDLDAIAANKSRSNWIDFWRKSAGTGGTAGVGIITGGGGGDGGGGGGTPGTGVAPMFLGGSRTVTVSGCTEWTPIVQFNDVILDPALSPIWMVRCQSWVLDSSYTVNVRVVEIEGTFPGYEAAAEVGIGTATNATDWNTVEAFQEFQITLLAGTAEYYRMEMQISDADGEAWVAGAYAYPAGTLAPAVPEP